MSKVLEDTKTNLTCYIYSDDHVPAHVHVFVGRKRSRSAQNIKISLGSSKVEPEIVLAHPAIKYQDLREALLLVMRNQEMLLEKWSEIHGNKQVGRKSHRRKTKKTN